MKRVGENSGCKEYKETRKEVEAEDNGKEAIDTGDTALELDVPTVMDGKVMNIIEATDGEILDNNWEKLDGSAQ